MNIGTRSVLYGAHCFLLHPFFVALAWWRLYGFPWDPRLWVAFFVHDLGYFGKPNMDGPEGEEHPKWGGYVMFRLFDSKFNNFRWLSSILNRIFGERAPGGQAWWQFVRYHSRYLAKRDGVRFSRLCVADKLAISLTPAWLYLPMVRATGEIREYMGDAAVHHPDMPVDLSTERTWYEGVQDYCRGWAIEHRYKNDDSWTKARERVV